MSEQSISTEFTEDAQGNLNPQTSEDKFFGVQTEITKETTNTCLLYTSPSPRDRG